MKIGILAAGTTPEALIDTYGSFADMFVALFARAGLPFECATFDVYQDRFPASAEACDGWLITGSKCGVYDDLPWMLRLKGLIHEIHDARRPLVGVCFGHQIIADAFGARVDKYPGGWGVGLHRYRLAEPNLWVGESFTLCAMHQDQVLEKPAGARVLATSDFCAYAALGYGEHILTLQAHPEFTLPFEAELIRNREGSAIPADEAAAGLASIEAKGAATDALAMARWMGAALQGCRT